MSSHSHTDLVGKSFEASIGEPWNFSSSCGDNILKGVVELVSKELDGWMFCRATPFPYKSYSIHQFVFVPRYKDKEWLAKIVENGSSVGNFVFDSEGLQINKDQGAIANFLQQTGHPFLVGSLRLNKEADTENR